MAGNLVISTINGGAIGVKNAIINGNPLINQRAVAGTVVLTVGVYGHDRWKAGAAGCTYTFATVANVTTITISAGSLVQVVEGLNLQSGTYTLSWSGTAQGNINSGTYAGSGLTGTATGGTNLSVEFNTGTVSLVQLEAGSVATSFDVRSVGQELELCQRYYWKWANDSGAITYDLILQAYSASAAFGKLFDFPIIMRSIPTALATGTFTPQTAAGSASGAYTGIANLLATTHSLSTGGWGGSSGLVAGDASEIGVGTNAIITLTAEL